MKENIRSNEKDTKERICLNCKDKFIYKKGNQIYCCKKCSSKHKRQRFKKKYLRSMINKKYGITLEEYKKITSKCSLCLIDKLINCHHINPKSKGGKNEMKNYVGLCCGCHQLHHFNKMSLDEIENYYKKLGIPTRKSKKNEKQ